LASVFLGEVQLLKFKQTMDINHLIERLEDEFEELKPGTLNPKTNFKDLKEWSSMYALILIALVDTEYDVSVSGEDLRKIETVQDLFNLIQERRKD
jgi:acyl carrier protein